MSPTRSLTELINLRDANGDRLFLSRLDRATGSVAYLMVTRTRLSPEAAASLGMDEIRSSFFLTAAGLEQIGQVIEQEQTGVNKNPNQ